MAASTSGALKAYLESPAVALGVPVYRDQAPAGQKKPYITVSEAIALSPDPLEDGAVGTLREEVQIDLWMPWKDLPGQPETKFADGRLLESYSLPGALLRALDGARLATAPTTVYGVLVVKAGPRLLAQEENVVHYAVQADVWRVA